MLPLGRQQDRSVVVLTARDGESKGSAKQSKKAAVAAASVPVLLSWVQDETSRRESWFGGVLLQQPGRVYAVRTEESLVPVEQDAER